MDTQKNLPIRSIKKLHIETAAMFAVKHIPGIDEDTLNKFVELVNVTGNFGSMCEEELLEKMRLFRKYVPKSCGYSLYILAELLEISALSKLGDTSIPRITVNNEPLFLMQMSQAEPVIRAGQ